MEDVSRFSWMYAPRGAQDWMMMMMMYFNEGIILLSQFLFLNSLEVRVDGQFWQIFSFLRKVFHADSDWWFLGILRDSKSPKISMTLQSISTVYHNVLIWMVSILPQMSNSLSLFSWSVSVAPTAIDNSVTFMLLCYFNPLVRSWYSSSFLFSFSFTL